MSFDYSAAQATATRLIARFGQSASLIPVNPSSAWGGEPTEGTPVTITAVDLMQAIRDSGGTLTGQTKRTLYVSTAAGVTPNKSDKVTLGGTTHQIEAVRPLAPGGTVVFWEVDLVA